MTPEFPARAALFRWLWVMVGGLCLRLTVGNVLCARSERKSPFFCLGRELWLKIWYFSSKQSLRTLFSGAYGLTFLMISHWMVCSIFLSFSSQMCSLSFESFFLCTSLNDDLGLIVSGFKFVVSESYTAFLILCCCLCHCGFVYNTFC